MKIEWLESVLAVARTGSFSEAAEAIPCAQSSVSRHVKSVEQELGVTLFHRSSNANVVRATEQGAVLLPSIERTLKAYTAVWQKAEQFCRDRQLPLLLGLDANTFSATAKAQLVSLLYTQAPEVVLTVEEFPSVARMEVIAAGKADAFLYAQAYPIDQSPSLTQEDEQFRHIPLGQEPLSLAFGAQQAPKEDTVSLSQLAHWGMFSYNDLLRDYDPDNVQTRHQMLIRACLEQGFTPKVLTVDRHLADIKLTLTAQGKGVFPCTIPSFLRDYPNIRYIPVADAPFYVQYYLLILRHNQNPALPVLMDFLQSQFAQC